MLLRAAPKSLRAGSLLLHPVVQPPLHLQSRWLASKSRNKNAYSPPARSANLASRGSIGQPQSKAKPSDQSAATVGSSTKSDQPEFSHAQEEFQTSARSEDNTSPQDSSPSATDPTKAKRNEQEAEIPFYDLTKGIPSTIDAELRKASREQQGQSENQVEEAPSVEDGSRGERRMPPGAYETSADKRRNKLTMYTLAAMLLAGVTTTVYFGRNWENEEEEKAHSNAPSGWGVGLFYNRIWARLGSTMEYYKAPAFQKLLPDPDPAWARPHTLVLSLEDLLVHNDWSRDHGWRVAKRPGVDYFIRYLSQYYEIVIWTSLPSMTGAPVIQKLDPFQIAMWPLFREATNYQDGKYIKDLSYLNRDLSKIIMIDTDETHAASQPENTIILPRWEGTPGDTGLVALIPFLEYVAAMGLEDTRKVIKSFEGKEIPAEFAKREQQARERFQKQLSEERSKRPKKSGIGFLGSALGIKSGAGMETIDGMPTITEGFEQGKMLHDQIRERGQKQYELMEKEIRENGEKWLKDMAEQQKQQQDEAMKGMTAGFKGWFGGSPGGQEK